MSHYRPVALFLGLALLWGGSFSAIEVGLEYLPPVLFAALRYDVGGVLLLGYAAVAATEWLPSTRRDLTAVAVGGVVSIGGNGLLFVGQQYTTSGVAAIIYSLNPILTVGFAWLVLTEERFSPLGLVGVVLGFAGVAVVARPDPANLFAAAVVGKLLVALSAVAIALGSVLIRRADPTLPQVSFVAWSMLVGAAVLHAASLAVGEPTAGLALPPVAVGAFVYLTVLSTAVAFVLYFTLLSTHGPLEANLVSYAVPVVATVLGWALLAEPVSVWTAVGFLLILAGFVLVKRTALRAELRRWLDSSPAS